MADLFDGIAKTMDVFFNGRPAQPRTVVPKASVTIVELIRRKTSYVRVNGKLYRVTCEEMEVTPKNV